MNNQHEDVRTGGFIGGSDARVTMGGNEGALLRLWQEKRDEVGSQGPSANLIVQLGNARGPQQTLVSSQPWAEDEKRRRHVRHPLNPGMGATVDGLVDRFGAVVEAKFMPPWSFSKEGAASKHMAQLQHHIWVTNSREASLSIITGGRKSVHIRVSAGPSTYSSA